MLLYYKELYYYFSDYLLHFGTPDYWILFRPLKIQQVMKTSSVNLVITQTYATNDDGLQVDILKSLKGWEPLD